MDNTSVLIVLGLLGGSLILFCAVVAYLINEIRWQHSYTAFQAHVYRVARRHDKLADLRNTLRDSSFHSAATRHYALQMMEHLEDADRKSSALRGLPHHHAGHAGDGDTI